MDDALDFAADVLQLVEDTVLGTFGHVFHAVGFEAADLGLFGSGVVELVLVDALADLDEFLTRMFPFVDSIVAAVVTQLVGEVLQLIDGALFGGASGEEEHHGSTKDEMLDFHVKKLISVIFRNIP